MLQRSSKAVALCLCIFQSFLISITESSTPTTLIDASGSVHRSSSSGGEGGVVTVLTSPGTSSPFSSYEQNDGGVVLASSSGGVSIVSSPGATLTGTSSLSRGSGAAAASLISACTIVSGFTESDLESSLEDTRHGQTLSGIFRAKLTSLSGEDGEEGDGVEKACLILAVPIGVDNDDIIADVADIFDAIKVELESDYDLEDLYDVQVEVVADDTDAQKVIGMATEYASQSPPTGIISNNIAEAYNKISSTPIGTSSPSVTAAILTCDDSFTRNQKTVRAKLSSWKSRTSRNLLIDNFGTVATQLIKRTMDSYDKETIRAAGLTTSAAQYRLEMRSKLKDRMEASIRELFNAQTEILEKSTLKKFKSTLLKTIGKDSEGTDKFYDDNAAAVRSSAFTFDTAMEELEVPSLSLTKVAPVQEFKIKLDTTLLEFPESPEVRLKTVKQIKRAASKEKEPSERSVDFGLDLVAMIRPDGFGNFQGFAGYQVGGGVVGQVIVGVHNDADAPDVISQFGGTRPPFVRVQPKLKVNVEL